MLQGLASPRKIGEMYARGELKAADLTPARGTTLKDPNLVASRRRSTKTASLTKDEGELGVHTSERGAKTKAHEPPTAKPAKRANAARNAAVEPAASSSNLVHSEMGPPCSSLIDTRMQAPPML